MVNGSLFLSSLRFFLHHPWQLGLTLLSIALGSAIVIAVDLANNSAKQSFERSVDSVAGKATHRILGASDGLDEKFYSELKLTGKYRHITPIVEGQFSNNSEVFHIVGIDPFAPLNSEDSIQNTGLASSDVIELLRQKNRVLMSVSTAQRLDLPPDNQLLVEIRGINQVLSVRTAEVSKDSEFLPQNVLLTDISTAQVLFLRLGKLDRIDLVLSQSSAKQLKNSLPPSLRLKSSNTRSNALDQMTKAFRTNLTAMSLLAILVSAFLVYNTMTFSVLQRRQHFAIERMLGVTGPQLGRQIAIEATFLALLGAGFGCLLGVLLGQGLLLLVTRTISDLYSTIDYSVLVLQPTLLLKGFFVTLLAVLLATIGPALEAARVPPISVHRRSNAELRVDRFSRWLPPTGVALAVIGSLLLWWSGRNLLGGLLAMFLILIAYSLFVPILTELALKTISFLTADSRLSVVMAVRGIRSSRSRTLLAIAALSIAISATIGVGVMISSFRLSVANWLDDTLQSDFYVSYINDRDQPYIKPLNSAWPDLIREIPGVASVSTGKSHTVMIKGMPVPMLVLEPGQHSRHGFRVLAGDADIIWQELMSTNSLLISESFAWNHRLKRGDEVLLNTRGYPEFSFTVAGIYRDYSASQGMLVMLRDLYQKYWSDTAISNIGVLLEQSADTHIVREQILTLLENEDESIAVRSNKDIKQRSLKIFDQTFAITSVLRTLVILVAFVGVFSALMALSLERTREYSVLRATGMTAAQLARMILLQTGLTGLIAGILALPPGWAMSEILISVINQRSFGWTMDRYFPFIIIPQAIGLAIVAALIAGLYPTRRIIRNSISNGLRDL